MRSPTGVRHPSKDARPPGADAPGLQGGRCRGAAALPAGRGAGASLDAARDDLDVLQAQIVRDIGHRAALVAAGIQGAVESICGSTTSMARNARSALDQDVQQIVGLGPAATLRRGYAIVRGQADHALYRRYNPRVIPAV